MSEWQDHEVFVTGYRGMLGRAVVKALEASDHYRSILSRSDFDVTNMEHANYLAGAKIINCAGIVRGRNDVSTKRMGVVNSFAPHVLAGVAKRLIHVSTDCVFDGSKGPYVETDEPSPDDNYGMSKLSGEIDYGSHLTVRTSFIGLGERGLLRWLLDHDQGAVIDGFVDWRWNGLYVNTLARVLVRLLDDPITGILHIEGPEISKYVLLAALSEAIRPDLTVLPDYDKPRKNMILESDRMTWGDTPDTTFSWNTMIEELKADHEAQS